MNKLSPPAAFYAAAITALRQDEESEVVVLANPEAIMAAHALSRLPNVRVVPYRAGENATIDIAAHFALVAADYLVTDHPSLSWPRARHRQKANAPYHAVWTWCADGDACASQNHNATAFVNVDVRHGPPQSSSSRQHLEVRTTISPEWMALPAAAASDSNGGIGDPHPYGMWRKRDVCVGYGAGELIVPSWWNNVLWKGQFADRKALLMQSAAPSSSSSSLPPRLLWPLRFPRHYVDGSPKPFNSGFDKQEGFFGEIAQASRITAPSTTTTTTNAPMWHRVLGPRPTKPILGMKETPLRSTWHDATTAILVEASMDNLFHILFHALPLREDLARLSRDGALSAGSGGASAAYELLPRYTVLWPGASSSRGWPGWEMATRALSTALPHSNHMAMPTVEQTDSRIEPLSLHCYPLVIGGHSPFWPSFDNGTELVAARPRVAALRKALWQSVKRSRMSMDRPLPHDAAASSSSSTILFQTRHTSRVRAMDNFAAVRDALLADAALAPHVRFIAMEELPFAEQLRAVSSARIITGVHGQGMLWSAMLPTTTGGDGGVQRCAALEIFPAQMMLQRTHAWFDYRRWSVMNGVEYFLLTQKDTPDCVNQDFRRCGNTTLTPRSLVAALKRVLQHVEGVPPEAPALTGLDWSSSTVRDEWRIEGAHPSIECLDRERNGWRQVARGPKACILKWHGLECTPQHHRSGLCGKV